MSETPNTPVQAPAAIEAPPPVATGTHIAVGRRKTAVARVRMSPGSGNIVVNDKPFDQYFNEIRDRNDVTAPLEICEALKQWDVRVRATGGGVTGQAGAVRLGMARALIKAYPNREAELRNAGFLTRDAREVERKKYGHRKARRRFQFSKR